MEKTDYEIEKVIERCDMRVTTEEAAKIIVRLGGIVMRLYETNPYSAGPWCRFCGMHEAVEPKHRPKCAWAAASEFVNGIEQEDWAKILGEPYEE